MTALERVATWVRHLPGLERLDWVWNSLRPGYDAVLGWLVVTRGLPRVINGTDALRVSVRHRGCPETYEPRVWPRIMAAARPGDTVADVGAYIGLYALALAKRIGPTGRVVAFEPDPANAAALKEHVSLNGLARSVEVRQTAVGDRSGMVDLQPKGIESRVGAEQPGSVTVPLVTLDEAIPEGAVNLLKIDVEGFEEHVLRGAIRLLTTKSRRPRAIFIEVHPFAWGPLGTTSSSLLEALHLAGYRVLTLEGNPVSSVTEWGEVMAIPFEAPAH